MIVIPAIDLKNGRCVRLKQGDMARQTVYSEYPAKMALEWVEKGAERLHLVDLDGAVEGRPVNRQVINDIVKAVPIPVQLGGGIRDLRTIEAYLDLGIQWVILGTMAYRNPDLVAHACREFPRRIILGIDTKSGQVAIKGWTEEADLTVFELAKRFEGEGIEAIVYTDILRDGMGVGPNIKATGDLAKRVKVPVIASGGISGIRDVENLLTVSRYGVMGMITGRALYEGTLDLREAIRLAKREKVEKNA
ncbi:MAG: 1-(5-phosphoribosyl)-5-[(5-phosphoribosylamino)methylideneamino]imidazole-4-carboxamide isomerase [Pseudomonadota bacterium]